MTISLIYERNNTIEDPEFKQALSDLNPDVIYEKLKVICKRNPKEKVPYLLKQNLPIKWPYTTKKYICFATTFS